MMYFLIAIGLAYIIIRPLIILFSRKNKTKIPATTTKEEIPVSKEVKEFADKVLNEVNKIIECSKQTSENLCSESNIKNPAILLEQIIFLHFINSVQNALRKTPEDISGEIFPCLLNTI